VIVGIIPARYASTRLPGKPLLPLAGKPLIVWVCEAVERSGLFDYWCVATDSPLVAEVVEAAGYKVAITAEYHQSGTDRCAEVAATLPAEAKVVVNVQGDEPLIDLSHLKALVSLFDEEQVEIATLVREITEIDILQDPNQVKAVVAETGYALYFSRAALPFQRDTEQQQWLQHFPYKGHIGLYAYRTSVLKSLAKLKPSPLEQAERLEQLRWLEHGYRIKTATVNAPASGVDTPEDVARVEKLLTGSNR
jgi:3-deoxy-manno-octulosonate cytidylyltransferase (CMP-KDO synthetase)